MKTCFYCNTAENDYGINISIRNRPDSNRIDLVNLSQETTIVIEKENKFDASIGHMYVIYCCHDINYGTLEIYYLLLIYSQPIFK